MNSKIKEVFKSLKASEREQLKMAHSSGVPQYIKIDSNRFIGVYLNGVRFLRVEEIYNDWYVGTIEYPPVVNGQSKAVG